MIQLGTVCGAAFRGHKQNPFGRRQGRKHCGALGAQAQGGFVIGESPKGGAPSTSALVFRTRPRTSARVNAIPLRLLASELAVLRGRRLLIKKPRDENAPKVTATGALLFGDTAPRGAC